VVDYFEPNETIETASLNDLDQTIQAAQWRQTPTNQVWGDENFADNSGVVFRGIHIFSFGKSIR
jgi:hypothetical protein